METLLKTSLKAIVEDIPKRLGQYVENLIRTGKLWDITISMIQEQLANLFKARFITKMKE